MTSEPLNQYAEICRDAIKNSSSKISKTFEKLLLEILLLYMAIQRKINFTQMERYGTHCEQTYRTNFNSSRSKCIDWLKFNLVLCRRYLNMDGLLAIAIDPSYISKSGKTQEPIGLFLQCIIRITECGKGDDEGKWDAVFHGFFQGNHGKHIHR